MVLAPGLLGRSCEAQNTKHLLAVVSGKTSVHELPLLLPSYRSPTPLPWQLIHGWAGSAASQAVGEPGLLLP